VGPARIPLKIIRDDKKNDLAILSVDIDLTSKPLPLAPGVSSPGEQIFAIGNPEGLEKTISQGIISGLRKRGDRELLQITSPISHGSSGGPILNARGEVVGVAVGMFEDGQNLNFAVPVAYVRSLLAQKDNAPAAKSGSFNLFAEADELFKKTQQDAYSDDPASEYQRDLGQLTNRLEAVILDSGKEDELAKVGCWSTSIYLLSDQGINAARKLVQNKPTSDNRALLSYLLYNRAEIEGFRAQLATSGSNEEASATVAHKQFLSDANREAVEAARMAKGEHLLVAKYVLGSVKQDQHEYSDAIPLHSAVATGNVHICETDLVRAAIQKLVDENDKAKRPEDAEKWFRRYSAQYQPSPYEWDSEGDRRASAHDSSGAADAYERAAKGSPDVYGYDYCYASAGRFYQQVTNEDAVLADGRNCVDASVKQTGKQYEQHFTKELPVVYRVMAEVLENRGVYQSALGYIKEAVSAKPDDPFSLYTEASIFEQLGRNSECIAAAQAAIALSDGKYAYMHFRLGSCHFAAEHWSQAAASFRLAAEADKSDAGAAFNLGLSLARQGYASDARQWYREALTRKPVEELREKILNALK
jgi:hypothetical protein